MASITEITWLNIQDIVLHIHAYLNPYAKPNEKFNHNASCICRYQIRSIKLVGVWQTCLQLQLHHWTCKSLLWFVPD
jgi:hypothetical protein